MKVYFLRILELFFPSTQDEKIIANISETDITSSYMQIYKNGSIALAHFSDPKIRALVHLNKFHSNTNVQKLLAVLLSIYLKTLPPKEYILIPIPLSKQRERTRGYNQVTRIAKQAMPYSKDACIHLRTDIVIRTIHTPPQTSLTKSERLLNLHGAFIVPAGKGAVISGKNIILLDDVTTTGATLREAKAALLLHDPALIICVAIAG